MLRGCLFPSRLTRSSPNLKYSPIHLHVGSSPLSLLHRITIRLHSEDRVGETHAIKNHVQRAHKTTNTLMDPSMLESVILDQSGAFKKKCRTCDKLQPLVCFDKTEWDKPKGSRSRTCLLCERIKFKLNQQDGDQQMQLLKASLSEKEAELAKLRQELDKGKYVAASGALTTTLNAKEGNHSTEQATRRNHTQPQTSNATTITRAESSPRTFDISKLPIIEIPYDSPDNPMDKYSVSEDTFREKLHEKHIPYLVHSWEVLVPLWRVDEWLTVIQKEKYLVASIFPYKFVDKQICGDFNDTIDFVTFLGENANDPELVNKVNKETKEVVTVLSKDFEFAHLSLVTSLEALFLIDKVNS